MERGLLTVIRRFPANVHDIRELALSSPAFRSLCEDLVEAESALARWDASPSPIGIRRCSEYRVLVEELVGEIRAALEARNAPAGP